MTDSVLTRPSAGMTDVASTGVAWTATAQLARQGLQVVSLIVLSRLLAPEAFGLLAEVTVVSGLLTLIADLGLSSVIVQRPRLEQRELSTLFWIQMAVAAGGGLLLALSAKSLADFYGQPQLVLVTQALALLVPLTAASSIHRALLMRHLKFRTAAIIEMTTSGVSVVSAVVAALLGAGVWSLVVQLLVFAVSRLVLCARAERFVPGLEFAWAAAQRTTAMGMSVMAAGFANYAYRNVDNLTVGKLLGAAALGVYVRGYNVLLIPSNQIQNVIGRVLSPLMARVQDDPTRIRAAFLKSTSLLALLGFPTMAFIAVTADPFVRVVFGPGWSEAIPVVRAMAIASIVQLLLGASGAVYLVTERMRLQLVVTIVGGALVYVGVIAGLVAGTVAAVAYGYAVASVVVSIPLIRLPARLAGATGMDVLRLIARPAAATCLAVLATLAIDSCLLALGAPAAVRLAFEGLVCVAVYVVLVVRMHTEGVAEIASFARRARRRLARA